MSYNKTNWVDDSTPYITADKLNNIENGIETNDNAIGDLSDLTTTANTDLVSAINELEDNKATKDLATASRNGLMSSADFTKLGAMAINNTYGTSSTEGYSQNYINTLNTYPSNETRVGTWYNGKPVYRRVYVYTNPSPNHTSYSITEPSNVAHYIKLDLIQQDQDNSWISPYFWNSTDYLRIFRTNGGIQVRTSKTGDYTHYITVEYTKTTD